MSTFLELVQNLQREVGVSGTDISAVTSQTGMNKKLVNWVADADFYIQGMRIDWKFLWKEFSVTTSVGNALPASPSDLGIWDQKVFYLDYALKTNRKLVYIDYKEYKSSIGRGALVNNKPNRISIKPDNQLALYPPPDAAYTLTGEYWAKPYRMTSNTDVSPIPVQFERAIIARAKLWFAEEQEVPSLRDDAIRELNGYKEDEGLLNRLRSHQLIGNEGRIMGSGPEITIRPE